MDEIIKIIGNLGFPMAISVYLLVVFTAKIEKLSDSIDELRDVLSTILKDGRLG